MSLKESKKNLRLAFVQVAEDIKAELPEIWEKAISYMGREDMCIQFLVRDSFVFPGKSLVDVALESPEGHQAVLDHVGRLEAGVHF